MKKILNHPFTLLIGLIASLISIFAYFSSKPDLEHLLAVDVKKTDTNAVAVAKTVRDISNDTLTDVHMGEIERNAYTNKFFNLDISAPVYCTVSREANTLEGFVLLFEIRLDSVDRQVFKMVVQTYPMPVSKQRERLKIFLNVWKEGLPMGNAQGMVVQWVAPKYKYINIGGYDFYYLDVDWEKSTGQLISQRYYFGYVKNHLFAMITTGTTDDEVAEWIDYPDLYTF
jgi:hypothetical protein